MMRLRDAVPGSRRRVLRLASAAVIGLTAACNSHPALARPQVPAEDRYDSYQGSLPSCADPSVFERIQSRFHAREAEFWKSGLEIVGIHQVREIGFRSNGLDLIPRRYCVATAQMNNQSVREVSYSIDEDLGIIGWGFDVEWCLEGLDRNYTYAPDCKIARP
jgi:hypothetical protein